MLGIRHVTQHAKKCVGRKKKKGKGVERDERKWRARNGMINNYSGIFPPARSVYYAAREETLPELMRPHLVIYLDVPVDEVRRRLAARPEPHSNSPFHTPEVIAYMEYIYKQQYLKEIRCVGSHSIYTVTGTAQIEVHERLRMKTPAKETWQ